jgi:branched-chain amino acid transport system substrate-binding protein
MSGPIGAVLAEGVLSAQAWVSFTNTKGGVNGHLVRYLIYDDGGDPARHKAQVQEAVERRKVITFLHNPEGITGPASLDYIAEKRIPVIGSEGGGGWFYEHPMYFPQKPHGEAFYRSGTYAAANVLLPTGKTKLATITCVEIQACADNDRVWGEEATKSGFAHVYRGRASVTQPDYSAECLSASRAGAQVFLISVDHSSLGRLALSCARQGYRPIYSAIGSLAADRQKNDPNLEGMLGASDVFPYFQSNTPATAEFQEAMRTFGSKVPRGVGSAAGWVSAKLFEKAAANMPEPPTADAVLRGLWSFRDESLGGLTQPLTFIEDQNAKPLSCWFNILIKKGDWVSPDGYQRHCL